MCSDCDLCSWGLDCKGFWELFAESQVQGSLGRCGNRREQVGREWQLLECAGPAHPALPQSGLGPLGKASTQSFSSCPQLCHQAAHLPARSWEVLHTPWLFVDLPPIGPSRRGFEGETFLEPLETSPSLDAGKPLVLCTDKVFVAHGRPHSEELGKDRARGRTSGWISRSAPLPR